MSKSLWIQVDIWLKKDEDCGRFLLEMLEELDWIPHALSWHYLFEPQLRLRVKTDTREDAWGIRSGLEAYLSNNPKVGPFQFEEYKGEEKLYGKKGWPIMEKFLQAGSEAAIRLMKDNKLFNNRGFFQNRFLHCLHYQLNPQPDHPITWLKEVIKYVDLAAGYLRHIEDAYKEKK